MSASSVQYQLPYSHLNLRRNPFGEFSEEERTLLAHVDIHEVLCNLQAADYAVQFVGEKGYGKTTHLLSIRAKFSKAGYVHIPEGKRASLPVGTPILIDEAQRLTVWQRLRLFRRRVPLVLGTHRDFQRELRRAGRRVETIHVECNTSVDRLHELLNRRIEWVQRMAGPVPSVSRSTAATLLSQHGPNIRGILHKLYLNVQQLTEISEL